MYFDTALNIAWLVLGIVALASTLCFSKVSSAAAIQSSRAYALGYQRMPQWLQLVGVASIVIALFPYISASDDLVRIANARTETGQQGSTPHSPANDLLRLYEVTDAPLIGHVCSLVVTFVFLCIVVLTEKAALGRSAPKPSDRGPPVGLPALLVLA